MAESIAHFFPFPKKKAQDSQELRNRGIIAGANPFTTWEDGNMDYVAGSPIPENEITKGPTKHDELVKISKALERIAIALEKLVKDKG